MSSNSRLMRSSQTLEFFGLSDGDVVDALPAPISSHNEIDAAKADVVPNRCEIASDASKIRVFLEGLEFVRAWAAQAHSVFRKGTDEAPAELPLCAQDDAPTGTLLAFDAWCSTLEV